MLGLWTMTVAGARKTEAWPIVEVRLTDLQRSGCQGIIDNFSPENWVVDERI